MTADNSQNSSIPEADQNASTLDVLWQAVREVEGLITFDRLVPSELLWDRPPGLPSGVELLWAIHLVDAHFFLPSLGNLTSDLATDLSAPDYAGLLDASPCTAETLGDLLDHIRGSRSELVSALGKILSKSQDARPFVTSLIEIIVSHDRRILAAFTERLYESGLG